MNFILRAERSLRSVQIRKKRLDPHFQKMTLADGTIKGTRVKTRGLVRKLLKSWGREMMTAWTRVVAVEMKKKRSSKLSGAEQPGLGD